MSKKFKRMKSLSKNKNHITVSAHADEELADEIMLPTDVRINRIFAEMGIPYRVPLNLPDISVIRMRAHE